MANVAQIHTFHEPDLAAADLDSSALGAPPAAHIRVANLHDSNGHYYVANGDGAGIRVRRADGATPRSDMGGFVLDTHATTDARDQNPALVENWRGWILLYFERAASIYCVASQDRGATWSNPVSQMPGILPAACRGEDEQEVLVGVQGDNTLLVTIQDTGDRWPNDTHTGVSEGTSSAAPFTAIDPSAAALLTDGTGPAVSLAHDGRVVMAVRIGSEADLSHWWTGDSGRTWRRVT